MLPPPRARKTVAKTKTLILFIEILSCIRDGEWRTTPLLRSTLLLYAGHARRLRLTEKQLPYNSLVSFSLLLAYSLCVLHIRVPQQGLLHLE